jgi:hypothetical protein
VLSPYVPCSHKGPERKQGQNQIRRKDKGSKKGRDGRTEEKEMQMYNMYYSKE